MQFRHGDNFVAMVKLDINFWMFGWLRYSHQRWAIKMFILLIKYIYAGWSGVMNWGSRLYRCFLFMVVSSNPTWNKDKFVLLPWISNRGILHPKQLSSDKSYKTSKTLLTWSVIEMTMQVADQRDFWASLHIGMQEDALDCLSEPKINL